MVICQQIVFSPHLIFHVFLTKTENSWVNHILYLNELKLLKWPVCTFPWNQTLFYAILKSDLLHTKYHFFADNILFFDNRWALTLPFSGYVEELLEDDFNKWMNLPLTLSGRTDFIKVNVSDECSCALCFVFLSPLDKLTRRFIWWGKAQRVTSDKLILDFTWRRLRLNNIFMYC